MKYKTIIDGVNVSECEYYQYKKPEDYEMRYPNSGDCNIGLCAYLFNCKGLIDNLEKHCIDNPDCHYKQLKRKEQECEQKDKDIKYLTKCLDNSFKTQQDSELYWEREKKKLKAENEKLEQTLIEIQQDLEFATYCESQECGCDDANECLECTKNHILQKISECEVKNDT